MRQKRLRHFDLPLGSVQELDGFHGGDHRMIETTHETQNVFDRDTLLSFHDQGGEPVVVALDDGMTVDRNREREARFTSIAVDDSLFVGTTRSGERFAVDLRQIQTFQAKRPNALMTTLAIVIPCVLITGVAFAVYAGSLGSGWG